MKAKASPLKAKEAITASPLPWKVLAIIPKQMTESVERPTVSGLLRVALIESGLESSALEEVRLTT